MEKKGRSWMEGDEREEEKAREIRIEPLDGESLFSGRSSASAWDHLNRCQTHKSPSERAGDDTSRTVLSDADIGLHLHTLPLEEWALGHFARSVRDMASWGLHRSTAKEPPPFSSCSLGQWGSIKLNLKHLTSAALGVGEHD